MKTRTTSHLLLLTVVTCAAVFASTASAQPSIRSTDSQAWSVREAMRVDEIGGSLRWPSLASDGKTFLLAADVWADLNAKTPEVAPPVFWKFPGGRGPLPSWGNSGLHKLITDGRGQVHLFWLAFTDSIRSRRAWSSIRTTVAHAQLNKNGWSTPDTVLRGVMVSWNGDDNQVAVDADGNVHVVSALTDTMGYQTADFKLVGRDWKRTNIGPGGTYPAIARAAGNALVIAYQEGRINGVPGSVQVVRSTDGGKTWTTPTPIANSASGQGMFLRLVSAGNDLLAMWADAPSDVADAEMYSAWSADTGLTWSAPRKTRLPGFPRRISTSADGCGGIVALVEVRRALSDSITTIDMFEMNVAHSAASSQVTQVFANFAGVFDGAIARSSDRLMVVFTAVDQSGRTSQWVAERKACSRSSR